MTAFARLRQMLSPGLFRPLKRRLEKQLDIEVQAQIRLMTGLTPTIEFEKDDVFIIGYPKSGNTWFQNLVAGVIYGINLEYAPYRLIADIVPGLARPYYKRHHTPMYFKGHHLPQSQYRQVVYLVRDGRDTLVSYFHHRLALRQETDFMTMVQRKDLSPCRWHEHIEAWLSNPYDARMMIVRYEDLLQDTFHQLQRFCDFVGVERNSDELKSIVQQASFDRMRRKEQCYGIHITNWPENQAFIRRGQAGSYHDEMPQDVYEVVMQQAGSTLSRLGYT